MKLLPIPLSPLGAPPSLNMWSSDLLWRYPPAPTSPLAELKTQLPSQLSTDPRAWSRDDVALFLRWSEREFDLPKFDLDQFQMNGKAICLLSKSDFGERCPGAGDLVHNVLHMLARDAQMLNRHLPSSPVTPTSRFPLSPHSHPPTPNWSSLPPPDSPFYSNHFQHFMVPNSVTLSPAPSNDSQAGSPPQHQEQVQNGFSQSHTAGSNGAASSHSESDEELQLLEATKTSPPSPVTSSNSATRLNNPSAKHLPPPLVFEPKTLNAWSLSDSQNGTPTPSPSTPSNSSNPNKREFFPNPPTPNTPSNFYQLKREFFPENPEPNTNGRLLWDFLQQLLNDPQQRYSTYIAWKCRDTGVFKIVDPPGLAKLWGIQKNHLSMNYDKMSRALRYYYRVNILRKVQGERHCYQFLRNPSELKSIKNISLLRTTMANQAAATRENTQSQAQYRNYIKQDQNSANVHHVLPQPSSYKGSMASIMANVNNYNHLTAIPISVSAASNMSSPIPPTNLALKCATHSSLTTVSSVKMEFNELETDDKPTDLSTNADRKYTNPSDCFKLIQSSNGLTTIQILRNETGGSYSIQESSDSLSQSPSPHSTAQFKKNEHMDEKPTDLSKSEAVPASYCK